jgi:hypothetical protein
MAIYSAEEFLKKVVLEVIIGWHVSKVVSEVAKELIRLQTPLKTIAKVTKLSLKVVESIKDEHAETIKKIREYDITRLPVVTVSKFFLYCGIFSIKSSKNLVPVILLKIFRYFGMFTPFLGGVSFFLAYIDRNSHDIQGQRLKRYFCLYRLQNPNPKLLI